MKQVDFSDDDTSFGAKWHRYVKGLHKPITKALVSITGASTRNPKLTIAVVAIMSIVTFSIGIFTNFNVDVNEDSLWSPKGSRPLSHFNWINDDSNFPETPRIFYINIHANGENVLGKKGLERAFTALDLFRETAGYDDICPKDSARDSCKIKSPTNFWNNSFAYFNEIIENDDEVMKILSTISYPDGSLVDTQAIIGTPTFDQSGILTSGQILLNQIYLPVIDEAETFEELAIERILELQEQWKSESSNEFHVEVFAERSFSDEFSRAIASDIPLVGAAFGVMSAFASFVFMKRNAVQSRSLLGFGAVVGVLMSIMTGYGLMFICGVPFTSITPILPFIMLGIGLDDTFILSGSFYRTDPKKPTAIRIKETIEDAGTSITLTTLTSSLAFALGCISTIPAIYWLCLYAFPTILIIFIYQLTFFVAILTIDENRVAENRRDCLVCFKVDQSDEDENEEFKDNTMTKTQGSLSERFMVWYADALLTPWVKAIVVMIFLGLGSGSFYYATLLTQEFDFTDVIPKDSYITPWFNSMTDYTTRGTNFIDVYFRNVDQADQIIQQQMEDYVNDLVQMKQVDYEPASFWLQDFKKYVNESIDLEELPFYEQFGTFFNDPIYNELHSDSFVLDENGMILSSRTTVFMNNIDNSNVKELISALEDQREVSARQPINDGKSEWSFFTFSDQYLIWEFYSVSIKELYLTTVFSVVTVCLVTTIFIPHWTALLFVFPLICLLYVDLLGVLQLAGYNINPISYVAIVISIGLLIDFLVHTLLRYFEIEGDREKRTKEMLRTMGSSVFVGGISTFLGVVPLAFSTSNTFMTIFVAFIALVVLGIGHGLIFLPVLLSMFGPESKKVKDKAES